MLPGAPHLMHRYKVTLHCGEAVHYLTFDYSTKYMFYFFLFINPICHFNVVLKVLFPQVSQEGPLKSPSVSRGTQRYVIDGLSEKSSVVSEPWERLLDILSVVGARCEWQGDKGQRYFSSTKSADLVYSCI